MSFGTGVDDIITLSKLAVKVSTAYKDAPNSYRHISKEVMSLQMIIDKVMQYFENTALSDHDRQLGQEVLESCQSILEDLDSLIEKCTNFKKVQLGAELKAKLLLNTILLNSFVQRFDISYVLLLLEYSMLISLPQL